MTFIYTLIIIIVISGIAIGRYPVLKMNRATISLSGAILLVLFGAIPFQTACKVIDLDTIILLFAMMIVNINLSLAGFFRIAAYKIGKVAKTPFQLLSLIVFTSGLLSALFLNDTICIMFTPLILDITKAYKRNPLPYLIGLATASNIGSTATIVGNPQNMLIGISSAIPFSTFTLYQLPVAVLGLFIALLIIKLMYKKEFVHTNLEITEVITPWIYKPLLIKSCISVTVMLILFFYGVRITEASLYGAGILLITRRLKPQRVFNEIDWSLLVFFSGLFVITGAINYTGLGKEFFKYFQTATTGNIINFSLVSVLLSNLISNVPAVMLYIPIIPMLANPTKLWLVLAMSTTLAGNLTLLGSVANLIVAETAKKRGVNITFLEYLKSGFIITVLSLFVGLVWFSIINI